MHLIWRPAINSHDGMMPTTSTTTSPPASIEDPHEEGSGKFCSFKSTITTNTTTMHPTATTSKPSTSTENEMQHQEQATRRAHRGEGWHGTWMPMEPKAPRPHLPPTRQPELGQLRHRHQRAALTVEADQLALDIAGKKEGSV